MQRHVKAPLKAFTPPDCRFDSIHVDIVGPLPPSKGYTYLFTCIDRHTRWLEAIPMVDATADSCASALLTGWISTLKEDQSCTSAEMVYGTTLGLPGDFFSPPMIEDPSSSVSTLRSSVQHLQFIPTRWHGCHAVYLPPHLQTATHMYVRRDSHKPPLMRPYDGPFWVLCHFDKHFTLDINGKTKEVTVDLLSSWRFWCC